MKSNQKARKLIRTSLDADGTLWRVNDLWLQYLYSVTGKKHLSSETTSWDWTSRMSYDKYFWDFYNFLDTSYARLALQPYDKHTLPVLAKLLKEVPGIELVTANEQESHWTFKEWFKLHLPRSKIHINCIGRHHKRGKCCLPYDIYIDDKPALAVEMAEKHPDKFLFLMDTSWNRDIPDGPNVKRIYSWLELETLLPAKVAEFNERI